MSSRSGATEPHRARRALVRAGDHGAFADLYAETHAEVFAVAVRLTGNRSTAEDVVAETYLVAWRRRESVEVSDDPLRGWLLAIATRQALNLRRNLRRRTAFLASGRAGPTTVPDFADDADARLDASQLLRRAHRALGGLSRAEVEVVSLCVWSGLTYAEVAAATGVPVGTVRSRLHRARRRLRDLAGRDPSPGGPTDGPATVTDETTTDALRGIER